MLKKNPLTIKRKAEVSVQLLSFWTICKRSLRLADRWEEGSRSWRLQLDNERRKSPFSSLASGPSARGARDSQTDGKKAHGAGDCSWITKSENGLLHSIILIDPFFDPLEKAPPSGYPL